MSDDLIKRSDAIEVVYKALRTPPLKGVLTDTFSLAIALVQDIPSADRPQGEWIPCSERLPEDNGDYLVCPSDSVLEDYSDFSEVEIMPYDADCEAFGWWTERYDPISLGYLDSDFNEFEVLAWMPLPKPWKGVANDNIHNCRYTCCFDCDYDTARHQHISFGTQGGYVTDIH